jgi:CRISPR system Cascade subunit CasD
MQSWGMQSQFSERDTGLEPSKSGVIGLLCAALGKPRDERPSGSFPTLEQLASLRMGVRVDRQGILCYDYHAAQNVREASAKATDLTSRKGVRDSVSKRYYLSDAAFLVGFESENRDLLRLLDAKIRNPHWVLYLGRKAFVPSAPVYLKKGFQEEADLRTALWTHPWLCLRSEIEPCPERLRVIIEDDGGDQVRPDQPISFAPFDRRFAPRRVSIAHCPMPLCMLED